MKSSERDSVLSSNTHTDVSVCAIREVFLCWGKNWPAAGKEEGGRMEGEDEWKDGGI